MPKPKAKPDYGLLGAAAEHYVMYRLLRMDMIAALAPAGALNADIIVSDKNVHTVAAVQIKARRNVGSDGGWHMKKKHTGPHLTGDLLFYCFVDFGSDMSDQPKCWIIPRGVVEDVLARSYDAWFETPGKGGKDHSHHDMRRLLPDYSKYIADKPLGWMDEYSEAWHLIKGMAAA